MNILQKIQHSLDTEVLSLTPLGGGSISSAYKASLAGGMTVFVKTMPHYADMFLKESNGLNELRASKCLRIPEVLFADSDLLLLEFLPASHPVNRKKFFGEFGRSFARMHRSGAEQFGFVEDNYIGSTPQRNIPPASSWREFYWTNRLLFQFQRAEKKGYIGEEGRRLFNRLEKELNRIIPDDGEPPALLHGDLWSGNYICLDNDIPAIIDPAVYYGHREADLGMTLLFGGFSEAFYASYNEEYPLNDGWEYRMEVYKLYHVMNHLNLFGAGYYGQVMETMSRLVE